MVAASKLRVDEILLGRTCKEVIHPWTDSCIASNLNLGWCGALGCLRFFLPFYLVNLAQQHNQWSTSVVLDITKGLVRSTLFGATYITVITSAHCTFRKVLGWYNGFTGILLPATLGGLSMFIDDPSHWTITTLILVNMLLEWLLYIAQENTGFWLSAGSKTAAFMIMSSVLLCMLRNTRFRKHASGTGLWFFKPPRVSSTNERSSPCPHHDPCWKNILMDASKYLRAGIGFQMLRVVSKFFVEGSKPSTMLRKLFARDNFMLGAFLASYVTIYKTISCILCQWRGRDEATHALLAGFLAGAAFRLHPNTTICISALTTILQLLVNDILAAVNLDKASALNVLLSAFCGGLLVNARYANPASVPQLMLACLHIGTLGRTTDIYRRMQALQKTLST